MLIEPPCFSQNPHEGLEQFFLPNNTGSIVSGKYRSAVKSFYERRGYKTVWIKNEDSANCSRLMAIIEKASDLGLDTSDYELNTIRSIYRNPTYSLTAPDTLETEIRVTETAIRFLSDIAYGNAAPQLGYNGLYYSPDCSDIPSLLASYLSGTVLLDLVAKLEPALPEIAALEKKIRSFNAVINEKGFHEVVINSAKLNDANQPLLLKLYQLGLLDSAGEKPSDKILKHAVQEAQRQFELLADGVLRSTTLEQLNVPLATRLQELKLAVNYYRWLNCLVQHQSVIIVNIPAAYMKVCHDNDVILQMRMVLGKRSTPTPTLTSRINDVILYPYWHVPFKIATRELLPHIKKNIAFLNENSFQVLNKEGKILDPYKINWQVLNATYFPYIIRQSTGCDNSLGLIKLDFYSPFGVYLHDTPFKAAFMLNRRYFSHGCLRMENPMELGRLVLKNNRIAIDTVDQKGCVRNQSPVTIHADEHMPVVIWYNPAGIDQTGRVIFYQDVYGKFNWVKK